jgi:DNA invertase Pin-like site-specific DNA recombinase
MLTLGYARLSSLEREADLTAQLAQLRAFGVNRSFVDREGPFGPRPALDQCLAMLRENDVFVCCRPDRLARKPTRFLKIVTDLGKRGVAFVVLDLGGQVLDTRRPEARQQLGLVAGVVKWQAACDRERQAVGIAKAKAAGKYQGRQATISGDLVRELAIGQGLRPARVAKLMGIARSSVYRCLPSNYRVTRPPKHEPRPPINARLIEVLLQSGMGPSEVSKQVGCSRSSVRRLGGLEKPRATDAGWQ